MAKHGGNNNFNNPSVDRGRRNYASSKHSGRVHLGNEVSKQGSRTRFSVKTPEYFKQLKNEKTAIKVARRKYIKTTVFKERSAKDLKNRLSRNQVNSLHRANISSGIASVTKVPDRLTGSQSSDEMSQAFDSGYSKMRAVPSNVVDTVNTAGRVKDLARTAYLRKERSRIVRRKYIEKQVTKRQLRDNLSDELVKKIGRERGAKNAVRNDYKAIRHASRDEVKRWQAAKRAKAASERWRLEAAKQRAIANRIRKKAEKEGKKKLGVWLGGKVLGASIRAKIAEILAYLAALLAPFIAVLLAILALFMVIAILLTIIFNVTPGFRGWYAGDIQPATNLEEAITEMTALYAQDVRTYCIYNDVPLPDDCSPEWGRTLALWSVLAQFYMGTTGDNGYGSHTQVPVHHAVTGESTQWNYDYSGVCALSVSELVDGTIDFQPGTLELLYFCFRVIHYDMIAVDETEAEGGGYNVNRGAMWAVESRTTSGMFQRGLPRMNVVRNDPYTYETRTMITHYGNAAYFESIGVSDDHPDCQLCHPPFDPNGSTEAMIAWNQQRSITHSHDVLSDPFTVERTDIVTTTAPITAMEALDLMHHVANGGHVDIDGVSYIPSTAVKGYCEDLFIKNFRSRAWAGDLELRHGARFALGSDGNPNRGCGIDGCQFTSRYKGCVYAQLRYMLESLGGQNMHWYYYHNGHWEWSEYKPIEGRPVVDYDGSEFVPFKVVGVLPMLDGPYGPCCYVGCLIGSDTAYETELRTMMIDQICNAVYAAEQGGAIREVWVNHLLFMAANCVIYDQSSQIEDQGAYDLLMSLGYDPDLFRDRRGIILNPDTFYDGNIQNAFTRYSYSAGLDYSPGLVDAFDWVSGSGAYGDPDYYYPSALYDTIFDLDLRHWLAQGYEGPRIGHLYGYGGAWCAWYVCYLANTNGLMQCYERGIPYQSYYNLLVHKPNDTDNGLGYFCNDAAASTTCQYMMQAFHQNSGPGGTCTFYLRNYDASGNLRAIDPLEVHPGDIIFFKGSGSDHRSSYDFENGLPCTNHVGVVIGVTDTEIVYLEGNTGAENQGHVGVGHTSLSGEYTVGWVDIFSPQY